MIRTSESVQTLAGLLAGAVIGTSVAVALVPASPSAMRDRLRAMAAAAPANEAT